jgi:hypothetical protein
MPRRRRAREARSQPPLRNDVLDAPTKARCWIGLTALVLWLQEMASRPSLDELGNGDQRVVNFHLEEFAESLYSRGETVAKAVDAILGFISKFWWQRPWLVPVWRLITAWRLREPLECQRPMPPVVLRAAMAVAFAWGWPRLAIALWLSFHCLLRPGELWCLIRAPITFCSDLGMDAARSHFAVLNIPFPKTRKRGPRRQHVLVTDPALHLCLRKVCDELEPGNLFLPYSEHTARNRIGQVLASIGLPGHLYSWGSLRAGCASHEYLSGTSVGHIKFRGRWSAEKSLEHYIQECVTFLDLSMLSSSTSKRVHKLSDLCGPLVAEFLKADGGRK